MPSGIFTLKQQELALGQGAWTNQKPLAVDYLVVAGGGGGSTGLSGLSEGAGGGAGGLLQGSVGVATGSAITVTVGGGGSAGASGSNSVFGGVTATGGGYGGNGYGPPSSGGSGGGSWTTTTASGISGQGNAGGAGNANNAAGGGGGAGTVGLPAGSSIGGNGGAGIASDISGTRTTYAGGGGGASATAGSGGAGGGGAGSTNGAGTAGTANTGGGGGGGRASASGAGGAGGSGIVIISYPDTYAAPASTTGSPTVSTSGSGSMYLNGSGSFLTFPSNAAFDLGTGDATIELWFYITADAAQDAAGNRNAQLFSTYSSSLANSYLFIVEGNGTTTGTALGFSRRVSNVDTYTSYTATITKNVWHHAAVVRSGSTLSIYYDGSRVATNTSFSGNIDSGGQAINVGALNLSGYVQAFPGYISNVRVLKGTAQYSGASYTVPTAPFTAVANTKLLLNTVSGSPFVDSSGSAFVATASGTPAWNSASPFATGLGYKNRVYTWTSSGSITF